MGNKDILISMQTTNLFKTKKLLVVNTYSANQGKGHIEKN